MWNNPTLTTSSSVRLKQRSCRCVHALLKIKHSVFRKCDKLYLYIHCTRNRQGHLYNLFVYFFSVCTLYSLLGLFLKKLYSTLLHLPPLRSTVSEDAGIGIEPMQRCSHRLPGAPITRLRTFHPSMLCSRKQCRMYVSSLFLFSPLLPIIERSKNQKQYGIVLYVCYRYITAHKCTVYKTDNQTTLCAQSQKSARI